MKKRITKIWSVGLVVMMLASLLVMAAPVSAAAQPLQWNAEDIPTTANNILAPGSDINDIAVGADGKTIYAAAKVYEAVTATITTDFSGSSDGDDEVFEVEYTDQDGATSTVYLSITENATEGDTFELELEAGDTGVGDITDVTDNTTDATDGVFELSGDITGYGLGSWDQDAGTFEDGALAGSIVYKSTNGGSTWIKILTSAGGIAPIGADFVSVAPDDNNLVAIADNTAQMIYISTNGGNRWASLRFQDFTDADGDAPDDINDIDMSAAAPTSYLAVAGVDDDGDGMVWIYDLGTGGGWSATDSGAYEGIEAALAVKFSPGFASDQVLTAVTTDGTDTLFEMLDLSTPLAPVPNWNAAAAFTNYPVPIVETDVATYAAIALAPDYLASDEIQRVAFVSLMGITDSGIYRLTNTNVKAIKTPDFDFHSLAYDGTTLVAGSGGAGDGRNTVWRSTDPLTTEPTFYPTASTKGPGAYVASADVNIEFAGTNVVAGTMGVDSAFAVSTDSGKSFNDIALIDTSIVAMEDVAVAADGSKVYMLTSNGNDYLSVWRYASGWQRVLILDNNGYIVRLAPANADVVYVAKYNSATKSVYYSKDGGVSKWYNRTGPGPGFLADLAAQDDNVAYAATGTSVFKTANGGFTWNAGPPADTKLGDDVYSLNCLGENKILAGSVAGRVSFTIDGNASWSLIPQAFGDGNVVVTADGLETGKNIYAGDAEGLYRWTIGQDSTAPWVQFDAVPPPPAPITAEITGIALKGPILYASSSTGAASKVYRTMAPFLPAPPPPCDTITATTKVFDTAPAALRVSTTTTYNKLWAIDTAVAKLYSFNDTLAVSVPALSTPVTGAKVSINTIGGWVNQVVYSWPAVPGVNFAGPTGPQYEILVSLDQAGNQVVADDTAVNNAGPVVYYNSSDSSYPEYSPGTTYYWKVKVHDPVSSGWSEVRSFTVEASPASVPTIASPANGATTTSTRPAFSWSPVSGATKYAFQLAADATFTTLITDATLASAGIQPAEALETGKTYFWRVRSMEPVLGDWSTIANFTVAEPAKAPAPPVVVTQVPAPTINIPPAPQPTQIVIPQPAPAPQIAPAYIWAIIIIGAILVIAVIVLVIRTRRTV